MAVVLVIGVLLCLAGVVLLMNLAGAGDFVMRHVTSRYLGSLPPGFANTKRGFRVYSILVISIGAVFLGVGVAASSVLPGAALVVAGVIAFVVTSVIALRGEADVVTEKR
ncbi:MAG TPA: hypothetical protein VJQ08_07085 [Candidatus Dormibacteraeota bacterium]|nr:hypothetical protein [Candidatus Dormibacteraeota bacterium]